MLLIWHSLLAILVLFGAFCPSLSAKDSMREGSSTGKVQEIVSSGTASRGVIEVDGRERTFCLYVPASPAIQANPPLVFVFHGGGGTGAGAERIYKMDNMANRFGFIVVYPDGINRHWHDGRAQANPGIDDVAFVAALINKLSTEYSIDRRRVYACGMSNGALFCNYLALKLSEQIKAIASVAGGIALDAATLIPSRQVSVMLIHGINDGFVPFNGGESQHKAIGVIGGSVLSHEETLKKWLSYDGGVRQVSTQEIPAAGVPMIGFRPASVSTPAKVRRYSTGSGAICESVVITNGGHTWPGHVTKALVGIDGVTPMNIDASELISQFFKEVGSNRTSKQEH